MIVLLQLVVLQRIEGRRRTRIIAVMGAVWAVSWLLLGATGLVSGTWGATLLVAACASVFAFGETLLQPTIPALVNDLAPDHLRGRYNAASSAAFQLAQIIAPPIAGFLIGHHLDSVYIGTLVVGCLLLGVLAVVRLEPQLPPGVNGVREPELVADPDAVPEPDAEDALQRPGVSRSAAGDPPDDQARPRRPRRRPASSRSWPARAARPSPG